MLLPYTSRLSSSDVRVVLASLSPRRQQLMAQLLPGVSFRCVPSSFAEDLPHSEHTPASYAMETSKQKAREVWNRVGADTHILIAADTVVVQDGRILEKPSSAAHALEMLRALSGRSNQVVTGVTLLCRPPAGEHTAAAAPSAAESASSSSSAVAAPTAPEPLICNFSVSTDVQFAELDEQAMQAYVDSNEPMDKAGGYGYQSLASTFVSGIHGCYYNVVGFPLYDIARELKPHIERILNEIEQQQNKEASAAVQ